MKTLITLILLSSCSVIAQKKVSLKKAEPQTVYPETKFEKKKAVSVSYWKKDKSFTVKSNKEIILSAGSIGSTQLLQVSGIGEASKLKQLGIDVINDLVGVGKNLQDHLMFRPVYRVKNIKTLNKKINSILVN